MGVSSCFKSAICNVLRILAPAYPALLQTRQARASKRAGSKGGGDSTSLYPSQQSAAIRGVGSLFVIIITARTDIKLPNSGKCNRARVIPACPDTLII